MRKHSLPRSPPVFPDYFMQSGPSETSHRAPQSSNHESPPSSQHGSRRSRSRPLHGLSRSRSRSASPRSADVALSGAVNASQLDARLRRLSGHETRPAGRAGAAAPGQRISEYERAMTPSTHSRSFAFRVVRSPGSSSASIHLTDFPNGSSSVVPHCSASGVSDSEPRNPHAYPVPSPSGLSRGGRVGLEAFLLPCDHFTCLEDGLHPVLPRTGGPGGRIERR